MTGTAEQLPSQLPSPLRQSLFRDRWLASLVSNLGSWMQDTAGTWLMAALTASPLFIALMQTAASLPALFLAFPAGAAADIVDRRRLLIFWQAWMLASVAILSVLTFAGMIPPWMLLALTFLLNIGSAMNNPAWQAVVPELVPREQLADAIALNSAGFNLARALGPALGGLLVAAFTTARIGAGVVFLLNSASFVSVIIVLVRWKRTPLFKSALPAERMYGSLRAGVRYTLHAPTLQATLARAFFFTIFASGIWALLAVVAQSDLHQGAMGYGILNGCLGIGAVVGAALLPRTRRRFSSSTIVQAAALAFAASLLILALARLIPLIVLALIAAGFAWTSITSTFNVVVQLSVPSWVQARALGIYQTVFWGGMAFGSALWGVIAEHHSASIALAIAATGMLLTIPLSSRFPLPQGPPPDLTPNELNRASPQVTIEPHPTAGPVMVTVEYHVNQPDYANFVRAIHQLRHVRLRDGAMRWGVFQDTGDAERVLEIFIVESWIEFLRQRERLTASDRMIRDNVWKFHKSETQPIATFMIYAREPST